MTPVFKLFRKTVYLTIPVFIIFLLSHTEYKEIKKWKSGYPDFCWDCISDTSLIVTVILLGVATGFYILNKLTQ